MSLEDIQENTKREALRMLALLSSGAHEDSNQLDNKLLDIFQARQGALLLAYQKLARSEQDRLLKSRRTYSDMLGDHIQAQLTVYLMDKNTSLSISFVEWLQESLGSQAVYVFVRRNLSSGGRVVNLSSSAGPDAILPLKCKIDDYKRATLAQSVVQLFPDNEIDKLLMAMSTFEKMRFQDLFPHLDDNRMASEVPIDRSQWLVLFSYRIKSMKDQDLVQLFDAFTPGWNYDESAVIILQSLLNCNVSIPIQRLELKLEDINKEWSTQPSKIKTNSNSKYALNMDQLLRDAINRVKRDHDSLLQSAKRPPPLSSHSSDRHDSGLRGSDSYGSDRYGSDSYGSDSHASDGSVSDSYGSDSYGSDI